MSDPARLSKDRYDAVTIALHWLTALLVVVLFGSALVQDHAPREWHLHWLEGTHVSLGIGLAAVLVARLAWRFVGGRKLAAVGTAISAPLSRLMHWALYLLLAAQVALGFTLRWMQGESFSFFGLFSIPSLLAQDRMLAHQVQEWHNWTAWTLVALAGAHAVAALFHRYVLRDGVLRRMLPVAG